MKFASLYSGSSGNALFVAHKQTKLLVDAGLSGKRIEKALFAIDELGANLSGILVTHEHSDHISGVGVLSRRYDLPVYANFETWEKMRGCLGKVAEHNVRVFETGVPFALEELQVEAFATSHDAASPVGYAIDDGTSTMAIATDTGIITEATREAILQKDLVVLESNHDPDMLAVGPYPFHLKQRIKGANGHLSNVVCGEMVGDLIHSGVDKVVLAHLSKDNNYPLLAYETTCRILREQNIEPGIDCHIAVASRDEVGEVYEL